MLSLSGVKKPEVQMTSKVRALKSEEKDKLLPLVKNIVPVASGKGGVGGMKRCREPFVLANASILLVGRRRVLVTGP